MPMSHSSEMDAALTRARVLAEDWTQPEVHNEHVILSLLRYEGEFQKTLAAMSISADGLASLAREVGGEYREMSDPANDAIPGDDLMQTLARAESYRKRVEDAELTSFHYLIALTDQESRVGQFLAELVGQATRHYKGDVDLQNLPASYSREIQIGLELAKKYAASDHCEIHNEHLIFALCDIKGDFDHQLTRTKLNSEELAERLITQIRKYPAIDGLSESNITIGIDLRKTLAEAESLRLKTRSDQLLAIHYLMALVEQESEIAQHIGKFIREAIRESS